MATWKRDFGSGLIVLVPILVTAYVIAWLYGVVAAVTPKSIVETALLEQYNVPPAYGEVIRVLLTLVVFVILVFAVGYLMRTTAGTLFESVLDNLANRLPGLRVVYNASKMAAETALGGTDSLQKPVKIETWDGLRMTAFKTGRTTEDGRIVVFLPTAPNITTGFVVEVDPERVTETNERVEDALTRILSAGFGDNNRGRPPGDIIGEVTDDGTSTEDGETPTGDDGIGDTPPQD